jgi:hypothetical protein
MSCKCEHTQALGPAGYLPSASMVTDRSVQDVCGVEALSSDLECHFVFEATLDYILDNFFFSSTNYLAQFWAIQYNFFSVPGRVRHHGWLLPKVEEKK